MNAQTLTCKSCGAPIDYRDGEETAVCGYCGTVNRLVEDAPPEKPAAAAPVGGAVAGDRTEALLKRGFLFLENSEPDRAKQYFEKVLELDPEEYRAYLGCLMIELSVKEEREILSVDVNLESLKNYRQARRFAPREKRAVLDGYPRIIQNRRLERVRAGEEAARIQAIEDEKLTQGEITAQAVRARNAAKIDPVFQKKAGCLFILAVIVTVAAYGFTSFRQNQELYDSGTAYLQAGDYENALKAFKSIGDGIHNVREQIRSANYLQAGRLYEDGEYFKAAGYYIKTDGYGDSTQKLRSIFRSFSPILFVDDYAGFFQRDETVAIPDCQDPGETAKKLLGWRGAVLPRSAFSNHWFNGFALTGGGALLYAGDKDIPIEKTAGWPGLVDLWSYFSDDKDYVIGLTANGDLRWIDSEDWYHPPAGWRDLSDLVFNDYDDVLGLKKDGTVLYDGPDKYGESGPIATWSDIKAVSANDYHFVGLKSDGTVVAAGNNREGQCNVSDWTDMIEVAAGYDYTVGLRSDGTVAAVGDSEKCDVASWTGIVKVWADDMDGIYALKDDGTILTTDNGEYRITEVESWENLVYAQFTGYSFYGVQADGTVLSSYDSFAKYNPTLNLSNIYIAPPDDAG